MAQIFSLASSKNRTISAVVHGFDGLSSWDEAIKLNLKVRKSGSAAFYSVSSHGLYGFAFADLGSSFVYQYTQKSVTASTGNEESNANEPSHQTKTITDSLSLEAFMQNLKD